MRVRATTLGACLFTALIAMAMVVGIGAATSPVATAEDIRPNIVLITTDDMTDYDLKWMPETRRLLGEQGFEFTDFLSPHPLCCPARAEILTGQYAQNNGVHTNDGEWGGTALVDPDNNVGAWLQDAGYQTAFVGKWLNHFDDFPVAGWDHFNYSETGTYAPYGFKYSEEPTSIENEYTADYVGRKTIEYSDEFGGEAPFFIWASQVAPHGMTLPSGKFVGAIPADRHKTLYPNAQPPSLSKPSFNEPDVSDKPRFARQTKVDRAKVIDKFRNRIRSLRAVDEQVGNLMVSLEAAGEVDNTVIIFTSDNGYLLGEHRLFGKNVLYEEALQVPLLLRGPGVTVGSSAETMTIVDVAATVTDLADAVPGRVLDGRSMMPVLAGQEPGHGRTLIQAGDVERKWSFRGVRTSRFTYVEHTNAVELYDRRSDPYQLQNVAANRPRAMARFAAELDTLRDCTGPTCYGGSS
jgi:arylsulfatase A-like enzyme